MHSLSPIVVLLVGLAGCSDDDSPSTGGGGGGTSTSTSSTVSSGASTASSSVGSDCTAVLVPGSPGTCPTECEVQAYTSGGGYTFCTESCAAPNDPCPEGTACLPNVLGNYHVCLPPCLQGSCPENMTCDSQGVTCQVL
jgi:hypothetical protein